MARSFAAAGARSRPADAWRGSLALVIEGEAELVSRLALPSASHAETSFAAAEPRWGAALHAANSNRRRATRRRPARLGIWASLGVQTGAAVAGLAVLALVVFPSGMTRSDAAASHAPAATTSPAR